MRKIRFAESTTNLYLKNNLSIIIALSRSLILLKRQQKSIFFNNYLYQKKFVYNYREFITIYNFKKVFKFQDTTELEDPFFGLNRKHFDRNMLCQLFHLNCNYINLKSHLKSVYIISKIRCQRFKTTLYLYPNAKFQ